MNVVEHPGKSRNQTFFLFGLLFLHLYRGPRIIVKRDMPSTLCNLHVPHGVNKVAAYAVCQVSHGKLSIGTSIYFPFLQKKSLTLANFETACNCFNVEFAIELY